MEIAKRQEIERKIVDAVVSAALMNGYMVKVMYDEETPGTAKECDRDTIMNAIQACDEEYLYFYTGTGLGSKYLGHVYLVYGNDGYDVICDHSSNDIINGLVKYGEAVAERLQGLETEPVPDPIPAMRQAQEAVPSTVGPLRDRIERLPTNQASRLLGQMEGFEMALRIIRNRASERNEAVQEAGRKDVKMLGQFDPILYEVTTLSQAVRLVMVEIGAGRMDVGPFTDEELDEIMRIF